MNRPYLFTVALAAWPAIAALPVAAAPAPAPASASSHAAKKPAAHKPAETAEPESEPDDDLNPVQLTLADRVLTGLADCELKQKVSIERLEGHSGNFKVTFEKRAWIVQPRETTTGAIVLVDKGGTVEWLQIPKKSMLMNIKAHQRLVDNCQENEQRIASQAVTEAAANAPMLAPSVASPAAVAATMATQPASVAASAAPASASSAAEAPPTQTTTTTTTTTSVKIVPPPPVDRGAQPPDAAASAMFK